MKFLLQRVSEASVSVEKKVIGKIDQGWLALIGISKTDNQDIANKLCDKLLGLRCFADESGKMNLSIQDTKGAILAVSQFTLLANCKKGRRPNFINAAAPSQATKLFEYITNRLSKKVTLEKGFFGADMQISLTNDGPVTILLDSDELI